jgi:hypothetical protein
MSRTHGLPILCLALAWVFHAGTPAPGATGPRKAPEGPGNRKPSLVRAVARTLPPGDREREPPPFSPGLRF